MSVLQKSSFPELSEANCDARLTHSKQLLKNIHPVTLALFLFTDEKIFTVATPTNPSETPQLQQPRRKTSQLQNACTHD